MATHREENLNPIKYELAVSGSTLTITYLEDSGAPHSLYAGDTVEDSFENGGIVDIAVYDAPDGTGGYDQAQVTEGGTSWPHTTGSPGYCSGTVTIPRVGSTTISMSISTACLASEDPPVTQTQIIVIKRKSTDFIIPPEEKRVP